MASVLHRTTKQLLQSVNTPDFPTDTWIINPDLGAVIGQPARYWTITGDVVTLQSTGQRSVTDTTIATKLLQVQKDSAKSATDNDRRLLAFMKVMVDEINILRQALSIPPARSLDDYRAATKTNIDGQS